MVIRNITTIAVCKPIVDLEMMPDLMMMAKIKKRKRKAGPYPNEPISDEEWNVYDANIFINNQRHRHSKLYGLILYFHADLSSFLYK